MNFNPPLLSAVLMKRYKRFLADLALGNGQVLTVHCPNTGSMLNCNLPESAVMYSDSGNEQRKYRHTLEAVTTPSGAWAGVNTSRANKLILEAIKQGIITELGGYACIRSEVPYGEEGNNRKKSRIDFLLEQHDQQPDCYLEVKNVTLEENAKLVLFPDAVTERGSKHLRELMKVRAQGYRAVLCFCVQHSTATNFKVAEMMDPVYAQTLQEALAAGVEVIAYGAEISAIAIYINRSICCELKSN